MHGRDLDFEDLANCIRLTHKYRMQDIYEALMGELKKIFPEDFATWEEHASRWLDYPHTDAIVAVGLAHLTDTPSILPISLYLCCQLEGAALIGGRARVDGAVDNLSMDDLIRCFEAKAKFCSQTFQLIPTVFGPLSNAECTAPTNKCETRLDSLHHAAMSGTSWGDADVLTTWCRLYQGFDNPLCQSCTARFRQRDKETREQIWLELSTILLLSR